MGIQRGVLRKGVWGRDPAAAAGSGIPAVKVIAAASGGHGQAVQDAFRVGIQDGGRDGAAVGVQRDDIQTDYSAFGLPGEGPSGVAGHIDVHAEDLAGVVAGDGVDGFGAQNGIGAVLVVPLVGGIGVYRVGADDHSGAVFVDGGDVGGELLPDGGDGDRGEAVRAVHHGDGGELGDGLLRSHIDGAARLRQDGVAVAQIHQLEGGGILALLVKGERQASGHIIAGGDREALRGPPLADLSQVPRLPLGIRGHDPGAGAFGGLGDLDLDQSGLAGFCAVAALQSHACSGIFLIYRQLGGGVHLKGVPGSAVSCCQHCSRQQCQYHTHRQKY